MIKNEKGFTLIEIICVMILIGVISGLAVVKFNLLGETASEKVAGQVITQMNTEAMDGWTKCKFTLWVDDEQCWALENYSGFTFNGNRSGGELVFNGYKVGVKRNPSTSISPATWERR